MRGILSYVDISMSRTGISNISGSPFCNRFVVEGVISFVNSEI